MSGELYETLGVTQEASPEQIKSAYRRKAKEAHPDAGGDVDRFSEVSIAYAVLSDPDARARYDATGEVRRPSMSDEDTDAWSIIHQALTQVLEAEIDLTQLDLVHALKSAVHAGMQNAKADLKQRQEPVKVVESILGRFTGETNGANILDSMVIQHAHGLRDHAEKVRRMVGVFERAISLLDGYRFRQDAPRHSKTLRQPHALD